MNAIARESRSAARIWYLAQAKPKRDKLAEQNLRRQGFETFSPKIARTRRHGGCFRDEFVALFPGYMFVRMPSQSMRWRAIGNTLGISRIVGFGDSGPAPVSDELVAGLRRRCDAAERVQPASFMPGDKVRIASGPFSEFIASVDTMPSERRIWLLLDIMGEQRRLAVGPKMIEREPA
jgi:transcriptional antiterminator RfaH